MSKKERIEALEKQNARMVERIKGLDNRIDRGDEDQKRKLLGIYNRLAKLEIPPAHTQHQCPMWPPDMDKGVCSVCGRMSEQALIVAEQKAKHYETLRNRVDQASCWLLEAGFKSEANDLMATLKETEL